MVGAGTKPRQLNDKDVRNAHDAKNNKADMSGKSLWNCLFKNKKI